MKNDYFDRTKICREGRSAQDFSLGMGEKFKRRAEEIAIQRISQWNELKRRDGEGFKEFWRRFERVTNKLLPVVVQWPDRVAYQKDFVALRMADGQKSLVRATMEIHVGVENTMELRRISCKLFDNAVQITEDLFPTDSVSAATEGGDSTEEIEVLELKGVRKTANKNRGGDLTKSIKNHNATFGMSSEKGYVKEKVKLGATIAGTRPIGGETVRTCYKNRMPLGNRRGKVPGRMSKEKEMI